MKPLFVRLRQKQTERVLAGKEYRVTCETAGSKPPATLRWIKGGKEITQVSTQVSPSSFLMFVIGFHYEGIPSGERERVSLTIYIHNHLLTNVYHKLQNSYLNLKACSPSLLKLKGNWILTAFSIYVQFLHGLFMRSQQ